ncbi:MAG: hypothetical protein ACO1SV_27525 [Fimbriimonas sp.]
MPLTRVDVSAAPHLPPILHLHGERIKLATTEGLATWKRMAQKGLLADEIDGVVYADAKRGYLWEPALPIPSLWTTGVTS